MPTQTHNTRTHTKRCFEQTLFNLTWHWKWIRWVKSVSIVCIHYLHTGYVYGTLGAVAASECHLATLIENIITLEVWTNDFLGESNLDMVIFEDRLHDMDYFRSIFFSKSQKHISLFTYLKSKTNVYLRFSLVSTDDVDTQPLY